MSFIFKKKDSYFWPVKLKSPSDGGKYETQTLELEFKKLKQKQITEALGVKENADFCRQIVNGWRDARDESGQELAFGEHFESLLDEPGFAKQIVDQYLASLTGAAEKN